MKNQSGQNPMQIHSSLLQSSQHQGSNKSLEFGTNNSQVKSSIECDPQQTIRRVSILPNKNYFSSPQGTKMLEGAEFSDQIVHALLELELKWIQKETQIKEYVQSLKKTIEEKDLKIEKLHIENYKLSQKLTEIGKQKNSILDKLNQIHEAMNLLQSQKLKIESDTRMNENSQFSQQNKLIKEILRLTKQKDTQKMKSFDQSRSLEIEKKQMDTQNMEKRILSNLIKLFEENFCLNPSPSQDSSSQKNDEYIFLKKDRQVRVTAATSDAFGQKLQGSFIKKRQHSPIDSEKQKQLKVPTKIPQTYKSARTITFSKDEEVDSQNEAENNRFYSYNVIHSHPKISSEDDSIELKESQRFDTKIPIKKSKTLQSNQNTSGLSSLRIESKAFNQSYECSQFQKQKRKRSKSKKHITNLDYSLSSSLVSDNQINQTSSEKIDKENQQIFRPLTHEKKQHPKKQIDLSNISVSSSHLKKSQEPDSKDNERINFDKVSIENSRNFEMGLKSTVSSPNQYEKTIQIEKSMVKENVMNSQCRKSNQNQIRQDVNTTLNQKSNQQILQTLKHPNLTKFCAYSFQNSPKNEQVTIKNNKPFVSSASKKNFIIERQNSITFESTNQKKSQFDINQLDSKETASKNRNSGWEEEITHKNSHEFVEELAPETKCSSFQEKSCGNSFYFDKTSSSNDPFKKLRLQSESSDNQRQNNSNRLMFENQMLKSYNKVLEKQAKKMSQTQKLMEKFSSQNVSILNKMHKKSIY